MNGTADDLYSPTSLRDYALIADGERGALIGPRGEVAWLCAPHWDSDAVFSRLIGGAGTYAVTPAGRFVWGGYYEDDSLVWRSRWVVGDRIVECREALAFPGDPGKAVLLRRIMARKGESTVRVVFEPAAGFGADRARRLTKDEHGLWTAQAGSLRFRWSGAQQARHVSGDPAQRLTLEVTVPEGGQHDLVLEIGDRALGEPVDPTEAWRSTERAWADQIPRMDNTLASQDARQSYAVLRGLTSTGGGTVAATTTSLPERAEEGRNYDYRYVWIRDQCFIGQAIAAAGPHPLLDDAVRFVAQRLLDDGPNLSPAYTARGERIPDQRRLDLPGYPGGYDLVGNWVTKQFQLDAFGEALLLFAAAARHGRLDTDGWRAAELAARAIQRRWREPDAGIWELDDRPWTHSRLTCAAGLRAVAGVPAAGAAIRAVDFTSLADEIVADTAKHALHPSGRWQRAPDDDRLDGALLLPPLRGALPADDPRTRQTLDAYVQELTVDHFAYRFRHDSRALDQAEGAFVLCGFVTALAQLQQGRKLDAARWFERNRAACSATGLFSEEYDVKQRQLRGNLPQAFVHSMLIESAARIAEQTDGLTSG
ncbi:glycoside hydrolase family 15 protein [Actinocrinis puniceicyclus]|uniref:Glycoside hydrolase family 15 protein n=1 Tax=Actinocrinis puniceicyclus TaxID=977794 RepID=A0A8J7WNG8_9ACTN|nr:glycoside hydrolase family 15 protein [Actinocrinis puniceicyclus]MBS2963357.1 glycoside hydrolase family 15 protein [Actinocrinis puniceicyclus]